MMIDSVDLVLLMSAGRQKNTQEGGYLNGTREDSLSNRESCVSPSSSFNSRKFIKLVHSAHERSSARLTSSTIKRHKSASQVSRMVDECEGVSERGAVGVVGLKADGDFVGLVFVEGEGCAAWWGGAVVCLGVGVWRDVGEDGAVG